jgi:hypothetical protein
MKNKKETVRISGYKVNAVGTTAVAVLLLNSKFVRRKI